ncbi:sulfite exporter TauE/SafE family protein [Telmatospirillum sp. J64-1]|uniref:sulfite exporter TauE/SafE family protein n=1 Tax=Telmatospirillum sp. J64-1 TaxID=2502183 RepID=UPI001C8F235B|nr:sulfite exporter TauE/SafE family protein [Telmatospirillum sp. J64-1]
METFAPVWLAGFAASLLATGVLAGLLAGLLGVGGGIVVVPVLFHLFTLINIDPAVKMHLAVGTSLAAIIPTSIISARSHYKRGGIDPDLLKSWGPAVMLGVLLGAVLGGLADGRVLTAIFGVIGLMVALHMVLRREGAALAPSLPARPLQWLIATIIGGFSTVMGIGGGTLSVPILSAFSYPIRRAVGTAAAIGMVIAIPGAIGFIISGWGRESLPPLSLGFVNLVGFALIVPASMLTAPLGAKLAHTINPNFLRKAFAFFLFLTGLRMLSSLF